MKRSVPRFLVFLTIVAVSGAALILVLPASLGPGASVPVWVPTTLGALLAVGTVMAGLVRPRST